MPDQASLDGTVMGGGKNGRGEECEVGMDGIRMGGGRVDDMKRGRGKEFAGEERVGG